MRAKADIDLHELHKLGGLHAITAEVAAWFKISHTTLEKRLKSTDTYEFQGRKLTFREIFEEGKAKGNVSLRRKQIELALAGDKTMLIWLGKQMLGQCDRTSLEHSGAGGGALEIIVTKVGNKKAAE